MRKPLSRAAGQYVHRECPLDLLTAQTTHESMYFKTTAAIHLQCSTAAEALLQMSSEDLLCISLCKHARGRNPDPH